MVGGALLLSGAILVSAWSYNAATERPQFTLFMPVDTITSLSRYMAVDEYPEEYFRTLNDLEPGMTLQPGQQVKLVVQDRLSQ
ncbi:MAG: hypothetical protein M3O22_01625 [Pseudomonadota bacterium]|nr:hypothetical protein [Pseudomonadota bacterium]